MTEPPAKGSDSAAETADAAEASTGIGGSVAGASGAPPLGNRPAEPMPGKASLADPQGRIAAAVEGPTAPPPKASKDGAGGDGGNGGKDGDQKGGGVCPDCGLPFSDHPDFAGRHDPVQGHGHGVHGLRGEHGMQGDHPVDRSHPSEPQGLDARGESRLPGQELDSRSLGGDPAEA